MNTTTNFSLGLTVTGPRGNGATFGGIGGISGSDSIWNGIGGFRGRIRINNTGLFIPYYFDIGAGGSKLTWQIASGLGYQTGWAGVSVTYRYLSFEQRQQHGRAAPVDGRPDDHGQFHFLAWQASAAVVLDSATDPIGIFARPSRARVLDLLM